MQENPHFLFNNGAWRIILFCPSCPTNYWNCNEKKDIALLPADGSVSLLAQGTGGSE